MVSLRVQTLVTIAMMGKPLTFSVGVPTFNQAANRLYAGLRRG
jgi:hypothetical protein